MNVRKIFVPKDSVKTVTTKATGKQNSFQACGLLDEKTGMCEKFETWLKDPSGALAPGVYSAEIENMYIDKNGRLQTALKYVPVPAGKGG